MPSEPQRRWVRSSVRFYEGVEAVAGDPTDHVRVAAFYLVGMAVSDVQGAPDQAGLRVGVPRPLHGLLPGHRFQVYDFAVGQYAAEGEDLVPRRAVEDGTHPGRVVADHPAQSSDVRGRRVSPEDQPVGLYHRVQLTLHDARFDDAAAVI